MTTPEQPNEATFFKQDVERLLARYSNLSVYAAIGALEVVKQNLLDGLAARSAKGTDTQP